jgi:hypothetical protein
MESYVTERKMKRKFFSGLMAVAAVACAWAQQRLHNGIVLPEQWPPRYAQPAVAQDMPVPYLAKKPAVITINTGRQLFVDSFLIAETSLQQVAHTPTFYAGNPVLEPDRDWERTVDGAPYAAPFSDGIWYDETQRRFKMWYLAGAGELHKDDPQAFYTCYAESADGKTWVKPTLDVMAGTNVVDTCNRDASTIWLDKQETDSTRRYKMFNVLRRPGDRRWQCVLKYSADGVHWSEGVAQSGDLYDRSSAFYNPFLGVWALSMRYPTAVSSRSRSYLQNADPELAVSLAHRIRPDYPDQNVVYWFTPSPREPRNPDYPEVSPGIYNFDAIPYESIMLGMYSVWQGPENDVCAREGIQKRNEIFLGYSRDGFHFSRQSYEPFMANDHSDGAWNWGNMQSVGGAPIVVGDSLYFYCSGRRLNNIMWDSYTSTGLATLRRDGFVAMHADARGGYLITEPLCFDGKYLFVNVDVKGRRSHLTVEVLDADGNPLPEFSGKNAVALKGIDSTKAMVTWRGRTDLTALQGRAVRLRFNLTAGDLYAFWVSPELSGESRGYTAGGGPGLSPSGLDLP